ncbi:hypothetical protein ABQJ54_18930 [Rhodanobacter sp. Si-c]|uniref:Uncharacterized protein n=1 Tax=Rhodanobacter lycopersici TaxID=3162487 RepID=A0ABV3QL26_9GAMM
MSIVMDEEIKRRTTRRRCVGSWASALARQGAPDETTACKYRYLHGAARPGPLVVRHGERAPEAAQHDAVTRYHRGRDDHRGATLDEEQNKTRAAAMHPTKKGQQRHSG